jgi:hypothetical protein
MILRWRHGRDDCVLVMARWHEGGKKFKIEFERECDDLVKELVTSLLDQKKHVLKMAFFRPEIFLI